MVNDQPCQVSRRAGGARPHRLDDHAFGGSASSQRAAGAIASAATASHLITPKNINFHPGVLHVARGDSVTWKWEDAR